MATMKGGVARLGLLQSLEHTWLVSGLDEPMPAMPVYLPALGTLLLIPQVHTKTFLQEVS